MIYPGTGKADSLSTNSKCCPDADASPTASAASARPTTCKPPGQTGICQKTSVSCSGGSYVPGYCPGAADIQCCPNAGSSPTTVAPSATPTTCTPSGGRGICQNTSKTCAGGNYVSGLCPGDNSISRYFLITTFPSICWSQARHSATLKA